MNYVCENPASDRHADNKTFSNQPWNPSFGQYAGQMLENPGPQRIEAGSKGRVSYQLDFLLICKYSIWLTDL